ncbi:MULTISPECIES: hypothetical protein [unclassified Massilia]|uniref:hypothetical protein n=1 Tax=unclassified Massilia TaxID=2609279 RepID=UPI00177D4232|nr:MULTISPECIES: hypothetical protein [unclassified Massilia]MBD8532317.1 hypothetical protein [Massilia sp. CFBP 13647]MBD8673810.1 hypothetical protein [Massilia sp. CFBP 13721]
MAYAIVPGYAASRSWTPLVLTVGLHLLLVLAWLTGVQGPALQPTPAERTSTLVLVQPLARPRPAPAEPPQIPKPRTRSPAAMSVPVLVSPAPVVPSSPAPAPADAPQADPAPDSPSAAALPGELLATSKAMAGKVDRELRNGSSPITAEPERKWERFAEAFAAARKGAPPGVTLESYTEPDGVIIYRKTVAGKTRCYRSGSVGGLTTQFGNADLHGGGNTTCPTSVSWSRH